MIIAVSAALCSLKIVALRGQDAAQPGARAHDVDDDAGDAGAGDVGDALLL